MFLVVTLAIGAEASYMELKRARRTEMPTFSIVDHAVLLDGVEALLCDVRRSPADYRSGAVERLERMQAKLRRAPRTSSVVYRR